MGAPGRRSVRRKVLGIGTVGDRKTVRSGEEVTSLHGLGQDRGARAHPGRGRRDILHVRLTLLLLDPGSASLPGRGPTPGLLVTVLAALWHLSVLACLWLAVSTLCAVALLSLCRVECARLEQDSDQRAALQQSPVRTAAQPGLRAVVCRPAAGFCGLPAPLPGTPSGTWHHQPPGRCLLTL